MEERLALLARPEESDTDSYGSLQARKAQRVAVVVEEDRRRSSSAWVIYLITFVAEMGRGLLVPTIWIKVESVAPDSSYLGFVVAALSCGRIVGAPVVGSLSDQYNYRRVLIGCNIILIIGALMYCISGSIITLLAAQFVMGIGGGSLASLRGYVAESVSREQRTEYIAYLT